MSKVDEVWIGNDEPPISVELWWDPEVVEGSVAEAATAGMAVGTTVDGDVVLAGDTSLRIVTAGVSSRAAVQGDVLLEGDTSLDVTGEVPLVSMNAVSGMTVEPWRVKTLVEQMTALAGRDPVFMGAIGYVDDVFPLRLVGGTH